MGYYCTVPQCTSLAGKTKNVKFHRFPRDITMADKWNIILKRGKPYTKYSKVCSLHFTQADYNVTTMGQWKTLSKDAVPSQNLPKLNPDGSVMVIRKSRTVKYREGKKDDSDKTDKSWQNAMATHGAHPLMSNIPETTMASQELHDNSILAYKLQTLEGIANNISPQQLNSLPLPHGNGSKPKKQDAFMQTDPVQNEDDDTQPNNSYSEIPDTIKINAFMQTDPIQNEDDDTQPNNSYSEVSDKSYSSEVDQYNQSCPKDSSPYPKDLQYREQTPFAKDYPKESSSYRESPYKEPSSFNRESAYKDNGYSKDGFTKDAFPKEFKDDAYNKTYDLNNYEPKDYTKTSDDYIPQTNEEYNKEAEKYALVRKSHNGYDLKGYQKQLENYPKLPVTDMYSIEKYNRDPYYQYPDSVEVLRNQQHNLQILQEQHRINENRNFFNENHIKQEIDISADDDKFMYERNKEQLESSPMYAERRLQEQRFLEHIQQQVKQEPDTANGETTMQPQGSPYYPHLNTAAHGYYEALPRPGPELLIAKQNALAAQTQLWQNTMKRPFFFNETAHYNGALLQHRYDDIPRILQ